MADIYEDIEIIRELLDGDGCRCEFCATVGPALERIETAIRDIQQANCMANDLLVQSRVEADQLRAELAEARTHDDQHCSWRAEAERVLRLIERVDQEVRKDPIMLHAMVDSAGWPKHPRGLGIGTRSLMKAFESITGDEVVR